jgi:hypothetical protein
MQMTIVTMKISRVCNVNSLRYCNGYLKHFGMRGAAMVNAGNDSGDEGQQGVQCQKS